MLPELAGHIFVTGLFFRKFQRDRQQVECVHRHPTGSVRLLDVATGRQRSAAIEDSYVVQAQETALEDVHALRILAVHPPSEVQHQLVEDTLQECAIAFAFALLVDFVDAPRGPRMYRRINVAECPFIRRNLSAGVHVPLSQHQRELFFGEVRIDQCQWNAVKCQVPRGVPGILPLVRHGDDVRVVQMSPLVVATLPALWGWRRIAKIALQPILNYVVIELLGPQHTGEALTHDVLRVRGKVLRYHRCVELVGFAPAESKRLIEAGKGVLAFEIGVSQAQADHDRLARTNREVVVRRCFRAGVFGIHRFFGPMHDVVVNAVFYVGRAVLDSKQSAGIGFVLGEEKLRRAFTMQPAIARLIMIEFDCWVRSGTCLVQLRPSLAPSP